MKKLYISRTELIIIRDTMREHAHNRHKLIGQGIAAQINDLLKDTGNAASYKIAPLDL